MGLTVKSTGMHALDGHFEIARAQKTDRVIALAGNPNVGKSTVFNALTGMNQHTGNWPGKTVASAQGTYRFEETDYILVDLPGAYSLAAHSMEEEIARDFLLFGGADAVVLVCDATCLERNLILALQTIEITPNVVLCVNLMDEAKKKEIKIDLTKLEAELGVPVVGTSARAGKGMRELMAKVQAIMDDGAPPNPKKMQYEKCVEQAILMLETALLSQEAPVNNRFLALRMLEHEQSILKHIKPNDNARTALRDAQAHIKSEGITPEALRDGIVSSIVRTAEQICAKAVPCAADANAAHARDRRLDRILTSKHTGIPIMLLLLCAIFYITIVGANYPSQLLAGGLFWVQDRLSELFAWLNAPQWLHGALVLGLYRVLAWVVSVMLPPMAIFFPLFTLLENFGYLPRVAFNLDHQFKKAKACGKQALTMCMGFGCNAAGVTGCRIIDSPRERLIAILTNSFVPCNGRFPTLIALITMFFVGAAAGALKTALSALILTGVILLGICFTFLTSRLLSATVLKGEPSSFTLELPPYRTPQIGKVIVRSLKDRTVFVLGRAAAVAAPAGLIIWTLANITTGGVSLLNHCAGFLDPLARALGMDGVILLAFILGFPANEIVVPIMLMAYLSTGTIVEMSNLVELKTLLVAHGWTWATALSTMLFCLVHWPCSTTCLTIKKETGSMKWTALSIFLPTVMGMAACFVFTCGVRLFGG